MKRKIFAFTMSILFTVVCSGCSFDSENEDSVQSNSSEYASQLFNKDVVSINITASDEDWEYLMENATSKPWISCDIEIDGETFENVGVKTKGNTSLSQIAATDSERYSLKLNFGKYVDGQTYYGLDKLALNNIYADSTYLKEYMSYDLFQYMDVPSSLCTFTEITVNGEYYGFFIAIEDTDDSFLERNYGEDNSVQAYKPESMEGGGGMGGDMPEGDFMQNGNFEIDLSMFLNIEDEDGNAVEWSDVISDISSIVSITLSDGTVIDISQPNIQDFAEIDFSDIVSITDSDGNSIDLSGYQISVADFSNMKQEEMGEDAPQMPDGADEGGMPDMQQDEMSEDVPQMPDGADESGMPDMQQEEMGEDVPQMPDNAEGNAMPDMQQGEMDEDVPQMPDNAEGNAMPDMQQGGGMDALGSSGGVDLVYTDDNAESYSNIFDNAITQTSEEDEARLIASLKGISEGENLEDYINVDEVLRYAACNVFLVNLDSYFGSNGHNYVLTEDDGVLSMLPWDYNLSFGTYQLTDATEAVNYAIDTVFSGVSAEERPIISKLLENEEYLEQYHEYLRQIAEEYVQSGRFEQTIDNITSVIDEYVKNDTTSFDGYDAYLEGVEALKLFGTLRAESVIGQLDGTIPATEEEQAESSTLIDASELDLTKMGEMNVGDDNIPGNGEMQKPDDEGFQMPNGGGMGDMPDMEGNVPDLPETETEGTE